MPNFYFEVHEEKFVISACEDSFHMPSFFRVQSLTLHRLPHLKQAIDSV